MLDGLVFSDDYQVTGGYHPSANGSLVKKEKSIGRLIVARRRIEVE